MNHPSKLQTRRAAKGAGVRCRGALKAVLALTVVQVQSQETTVHLTEQLLRLHLLWAVHLVLQEATHQ